MTERDNRETWLGFTRVGGGLLLASCIFAGFVLDVKIPIDFSLLSEALDVAASMFGYALLLIITFRYLWWLPW